MSESRWYLASYDDEKFFVDVNSYVTIDNSNTKCIH